MQYYTTTNRQTLIAGLLWWRKLKRLNLPSEAVSNERHWKEKFKRAYNPQCLIGLPFQNDVCTLLLYMLFLCCHVHDTQREFKCIHWAIQYITRYPMGIWIFLNSSILLYQIIHNFLTNAFCKSYFAMNHSVIRSSTAYIFLVQRPLEPYHWTSDCTFLFKISLFYSAVSSFQLRPMMCSETPYIMKTIFLRVKFRERIYSCTVL